MGLFSQDQLDQINAVAAKSKEVLKPVQVSKSVTSTQHEIDESTRSVLEYFGDSPAILITTIDELHDYITKVIESGYCSIDTETTGKDLVHDTIVGCSLYYPGGVECYIPNKHIVPIFETPYKNQLTYEEVGRELKRLVITNVKTIWYNADFDIAMTYKDYGVDFIPVFYYDCMIAWRCLKENETAHGLKAVYAKYVQGGKGDPKRFTDFFSVKLFPYSKPDVAKLYAANDAKITFELFMWQLPYITKSHIKCQKNHLERIADLVWNIEFPMVKICATMHRTGVYLDLDTSRVLQPRYHARRDKEFGILSRMISEVMSQTNAMVLRKAPFRSAETFNPNSPPQVSYLLRDIMGLELESTEKEYLAKLKIPLVDQLLKVRSIDTILGSFVDKLPGATGPTGRVHSSFNSIGADCITGDSLLLTDKGYLPIRELFTGEEPNGDYSEEYVRVVNKDLKYEATSHKVVYYNTPTIKLKLRGGFSIEGTPNHPIICRDTTGNIGFKKLEEIVMTDQVCIPVGFNRFPAEYAVFDDSPVNEATAVVMAEHFTALGCQEDLQRIMNSPRSVVIAFIKGLFLKYADYDANSQELRYQAPIGWDSLTMFLQQALANLGILSVRYCIIGGVQFVYISGSELEKFVKLCGITDEDIPRLPEIYNPSIFNVVDNTYYAPVCSIEESTNDVYDLTVPGTHSFIANGMVNHNTGRMSSSEPNVQNIPSHALDVRHQFRATPAMEKIDLCEEIDGIYQITLGSYDSVTLMFDNEQRDVIDLKVDDRIKLYNEDGSYLCVTEIVHTLPTTTLKCSLLGRPISECKLLHITPAYVMMSSDYSQQEPKILAYMSQDANMIEAFKNNRDIYATIAALAFNCPYEECLEFNPITGANQPEGKDRRSKAKKIVLGINYGMSTKSIGEDLFGKNKNMTEKDRTREADKIYDAVLGAFPSIKAFMDASENNARQYGFVETILGRRRHIPAMQLKPYEFKAGPGYVNPDIDPLDPKTLHKKNELSPKVVAQLEKEFSKYKYKGQIYERIKQLSAQHIIVVNNSTKIAKGKRKCCNSCIQGSAAETTKIALIKVFNNPEWKALGARVLLPVHDELIAEAPLRNAKRAGELLSALMSEAGSFLPFTINCDVTTTLRWYGLAYPCEYTKPESIEHPDQLSESEIAWVQYQLFELEYPLPIHKKEGVKLEGDKALGVDGEWSEEMDRFIADYMTRYNIGPDQFLDHIENKVIYDLQKIK